MDLLKYPEFALSIGCMVCWTAAFLYQSTIMNPMLSTIYELEPEKSSLFYTLAGVAFLITTPVAFLLRSKKLAKRRTIMFWALFFMGVGMIIRTGDLRGEAMIYWVYLGQCLNGVTLALLTTTTFPEIVDSVEKTKEYEFYDKERVNIYVSGFFVLLSSIAQALGTFAGSFAADMIGYNWAFISGGIALIVYAFVYYAITGTGEDFVEVEKSAFTHT